MLARRPREHRPRDLRGDTPAPVGRLDAVADLDPAVLVRWTVEPDGPDDMATRLVLDHDGSPEPRLGGRILGQVGDPELQELVELVRQRRRDGSPDLRRGRDEIVLLEEPHEPQAHRHELVALVRIRRDDGRGGHGPYRRMREGAVSAGPVRDTSDRQSAARCRNAAICSRDTVAVGQNRSGRSHW